MKQGERKSERCTSVCVSLRVCERRTRLRDSKNLFFGRDNPSKLTDSTILTRQQRRQRIAGERASESQDQILALALLHACVCGSNRGRQDERTRMKRRMADASEYVFGTRQTQWHEGQHEGTRSGNAMTACIDSSLSLCWDFTSSALFIFQFLRSSMTFFPLHLLHVFVSLSPPDQSERRKKEERRGRRQTADEDHDRYFFILFLSPDSAACLSASLGGEKKKESCRCLAACEQSWREQRV